MADGEHLDPRVAALLAHRGATRVPGDGREWLGDDPEADALLRRDGVAMLLGLVLQRGMPAERVWRIPLHLRRELGHLDPERLGKLPEAEVEAALRRLPARPRYPGQSATTIVALGRLVHERFGGDGRRVWEGRHMADVLTTLQSLPGVGPGIAHMAVQLLIDEVGFLPHPDELPSLDVKADVHVVRVFYRLGLSTDETREAVLDAARRLHPAFPGLLDWPAWDVGRRLCRPTAPVCHKCPFEATCERRGVGAQNANHQAAPSGAPETHPTPVALALPLAEATTPSGSDPRADEAFWRLLSRLLAVALQSADVDSVAHRFASIAPLLGSAPHDARMRVADVAVEILRERLIMSGKQDATEVLRAAEVHRLIRPSDLELLRRVCGNPPQHVSVADAVSFAIQTVWALGTS